MILLAERLVRPTETFVIMSFAQRGELRDAYNTLVRVCSKFGYRAFKVDEHLDSTRRIVPAITSAIRRSAFVVADVTDPRPNVYYELGYAHALGKDVVVTAKEGTALPFDIFDVPTQYWDSQDTLEKKLETEFTRMGISVPPWEAARNHLYYASLSCQFAGKPPLTPYCWGSRVRAIFAGDRQGGCVPLLPLRLPTPVCSIPNWLLELITSIRSLEVRDIIRSGMRAVRLR